MKKSDIGRRKLRKAACMLTAGMMILSVGAVFTGCGKNSGNTAIVDQAEALKTLAYTVDEINVDIDIGNVVSRNDRLYGVTYSYTNTNDVYLSTYSIVIMDTQCNVLKTIPVFEQTKENDWGYINGDLNVDAEGNVTCMLSRSSYDETTSEYSESNQLITFDAEGNQTAVLDLDQIVTEEDNEHNRWFQGYVIGKDGNIYCNLYTCVRVLDSTGKVLFTTEELDRDSAWSNGLILTNEGVPAVNIYEYSNDTSKNSLREIDVAAKGFGKEYILPSSVGTIYSGSGDYICYTSSDTGISGIRADNQAKESVLNLLNLGVNNSQVDAFTICDDGSFITSAWDWSGRRGKKIISFIRPVDSSQIKEKKIISLGCYYLSWSIRSSIADFNRTNENYTINVTSFSENNDTSDWNAALTKFNNELLAGNVPDILLINNNMPYDSYAAKGLFTDLYALMENDPELSRDAFLPNVLKALETDGKLYSLSPSFSVQTYAAKTSIVGDAPSLTVDKANEILAQMGEDAQLTSYLMSSSDVLSTAISFGNFVDYKSGTCSFDSPEFIAVLEMANTYPNEIDYESLYNSNPNYWQEQERACRDNKALLYSTYLYDFDSYNRVKKGNFGEDITFVGFPGAGGDTAGGLLNFNNGLAISSKSQFKEGSWEFIKSLILNSVTQEETEIYNPNASEDDDPITELRWVSNNDFPVLTDQLEKLGKQATDPYKRMNENGELVPEQNIYYIADEEIEMTPISQKEADDLIAYLKTIDRASKYDESLNTIINEESSNYFAGTKSADETAKMIQSRASIYLSEQYR